MLFTLPAWSGWSATYRPARDGSLTEFLLLGPIEDPGVEDRDWRDSLAIEHASAVSLADPTAGREEVLDRTVWEPRARSSRAEVPVTWTHVASSQPVLDLPATRYAVAYLAAEIESIDGFDGWLLLGCDDDVAVWLDGERLEVPPFPGWFTPDQHWVRIALTPGRHTLILKVLNGRGRWAVQARIADTSMGPADSLIVRLPGVEETPGSILARLQVEPRVEVTRAGPRWHVEVDSPAVRSVGGGVLCLEDDDGAGLGCAPIETTWAGPWRIPIPTPLPGELHITAHFAGPQGRAERRLRHVIPEQSRAVQAVADALTHLHALDAAPWGEGSGPSYQFEVQDLTRLIESLDDDTSYLERRARHLEGLNASIEEGGDPYAGLTGAFTRAYRSPIDGRLQPYAVYIPPGRQRSPRPLVVSLRGLSSPLMLNLRQVLGFDREEGEEAERAARGFPDSVGDHDAIYVVPWGYGDTLFRFMGEEDVLAVMQTVQRVYAVDPDRVYLTGLSMGGIGALDLATHFAQEFAAVLALAGTADLRRYSEFRRYPAYSWELTLADEYCAAGYAANLRHVPVLAVHGLRDGTHYSHSSEFVEQLQNMGYRASLETPNLRHNVWRTTYADGGTMDRLGGYERVGFPPQVDLTTPSYRYATAYWLTIERLAAVHAFGRVSGTFRRRGGARVLALETDGVLGIRLDLEDAPARWRRDSLTVRVDGDVVCEGPCWRTVSVARGAGAWAEGSNGAVTSARLKGPGLSGPVQDAWHGPMIVAYGTGDSDLMGLTRRLAQAEARFGPRVTVQLEVVADHAVTAEQMAAHHVILVGTPDPTTPIGRAVAQIPLSIDGAGLRLGEHRLEGEHLSGVVIYPNPLEPSRYLVWKMGTSAPALDALRFVPRFLPDFAVFDQSVRQNMPDRRTFRGATVLAGGFFTDSWSLPPASQWLAPVAD